MATDSQLHPDYSTDTHPGAMFDPEDWVEFTDYDGDVYYLAPMNLRGGIAHHILRGSCDAEVDDDEGDGTHICGYDAAVRRVNDNGAEEFCAIHAPDEWTAPLENKHHLDNTLVDLRLPCDAFVAADSDPSALVGEKSPRSDTCGDRAFVLLTRADGTAKAFCRSHARDSWYDSLTIPTGEPPGDEDVAMKEYEDYGAAEFVDATSRESYVTWDDWYEGVNGSYPDIVAARERLVVLNGSGKPLNGKPPSDH